MPRSLKLDHYPPVYGRLAQAAHEAGEAGIPVPASSRKEAYRMRARYYAYCRALERERDRLEARGDPAATITWQLKQARGNQLTVEEQEDGTAILRVTSRSWIEESLQIESALEAVGVPPAPAEAWPEEAHEEEAPRETDFAELYRRGLGLE